MLEIPTGSIYIWMYRQGLRQVAIEDIEAACSMAGVDIRQKDYENYWRGWYKADLYATDNWEKIFRFHKWIDAPSSDAFFDHPYHDYPSHPYDKDIEDRWVPCNKDNKPMIKWGDGCMGIMDASCYPGQVYLAENLKGCNRIVIDCDGDHGDELDMETIMFLWRLAYKTHALMKPCYIEGTRIPVSFHLTFEVDRVIPTMHFPYAHIDIVGNRRNSLRYLKNKEWNDIGPAKMTDEIWAGLQRFIKYRKETSCQEV